MSEFPAAEFAKARSENQRESTLLPMLIGGPALALVGMLVIVLFV